MINRGSQLRISLPAHPPSARSRTLMALSPTPTAVAAPPPEPGPEPAPSAELPLPDAIAAALPPDPYEQLEVARKITAVAVASRASRLELEAARLRQRLADRDRLAAELADRAAKLEQALRDADARLRSALDDNAKLAKERDSLAQTSKKLARDLAKLETFKRHLMQSLGDDNSQTHHQETVDIRTYEQSVAKANSWKDGLEKNSHPVSSLSDESVEADSVNQEVTTRPFEQKLTITHITPRLTSDPAPKLRTAATSPRRYSTAVSPKLASGATSPRLEGHMAMSPWLPSSKMSSAANSPPRGQSISGGALTRYKSRWQGVLSSSKETLRKADEIFGAENMDLFRSFQGLLSRSLS
ncbi:hypothetical protein ZEAMMB73_Zm00001d043333 [Zea mays]|uniref:At4g15545-like C-terminal domain-containing protein n=1 Tax=Zea mays TaxID=4577 RepID=A0A1D6NAM7_MAIZE|nr:hypothetical protein ZEAMMB73_Zm00001d043333 [Zea mays]